MNISIDLHGVLDQDPSSFKKYIHNLVKHKHDVYVTTGLAFVHAIVQVKDLGFNLDEITEIISVTDYLLEKKIPWSFDKFKRPYFDEKHWWDAKGEIARERNFDLHIDDQNRYESAFTTPFILWSKNVVNKT